MPVIVDYPRDSSRPSPIDEDNIIAALEQADRVHRVEMFTSDSLLRKVATVMQKSFPALTHLGLGLLWDYDYDDEISIAHTPVLPKGFLNESAPCLQYLHFESFPFSEAPTFLLSSHNLVTLKLEEMFEDSFSPEAMVECLSGMARLKTLSLSFDYFTASDMDLFAFDRERTRLDLTTRIILPSLTRFHYAGHSGFLENFIAQIDAPLLLRLGITYYTFQVQAPQLFRFLGHTENFKFDQFSRAQAHFRDQISVELYRSQGTSPQASPSLSISIRVLGILDVQVLDTARFLGRCGTTLSNVKNLSVNGHSILESSSYDLGSAVWLPFFLLFPAVQDLHLSGEVGAKTASALERTTEEMVTEIFPALDTIWIDDEEYGYHEPLEEGSMKLLRFLSLRHRTGYLVTIVDTREDPDEKLNSESVWNGQVARTSSTRSCWDSPG